MSRGESDARAGGDRLASLPEESRFVPATPFRRRSGLLLLLASCASLAAAFLLLVFRGPEIQRISVGSDSYSRSALGHSLLVKLLQQLHRPVVQSRHRSDVRAKNDVLLVVAEPRGESEEIAKVVGAAQRVLVVLQKRQGEADPGNAERIGASELVDLERVGEVLGACKVRGAAVRPARADLTGTASLPLPTIAQPQLLQPQRGALRATLVGSSEGALVAEIARSDRHLWVLADPDPIANHGIDDGDNAAFAVALLDELRDGRPILIDETLHGWELEPSAFAQLGHFPLVLLLVQLFLLTAVIAWLAAGRFGAPVAPPPAIAPGKAFLVENIASLLAFGRHDALSLRRFVQLRVQQAAQRVARAPGDHGAAVAWLAARAGAAGGRLIVLAEAADQGHWPKTLGSALQVAQEFERTLEEITNGHR